MTARWSKPLFSGKGSCLGFPTLTQKFTLAHGSRKPAGCEGGRRGALDWKQGRKAEKCYSTKYFGAAWPSGVSLSREIFLKLGLFCQFYRIFCGAGSYKRSGRMSPEFRVSQQHQLMLCPNLLSHNVGLSSE